MIMIVILSGQAASINPLNCIQGETCQSGQHVSELSHLGLRSQDELKRQHKTPTLYFPSWFTHL